MKKHIWLILGIMLVSAFAKAQEFVSHQVTSGETIYSISRKYDVSAKEIIKLNPDAKERIYEGLVLILPSKAKKTEPIGGGITPPQDDLSFKTHKVKRKETLFSISKRYNVPIDIIKKYNKELYSKPLRKGKKLRIPTNYQEVIAQQEKPDPETTTAVLSAKLHTVKPKETRYSIARSYGITITELDLLNPKMGTILSIGQQLNVPNTTPAIAATIDDTKYELYEVQKGDTMYSLLKRIALEADDLIALNPALDEGLKQGMILKIPRTGTPTEVASTSNDTIAVSTGDTSQVNLADNIRYPSTKKIAVLLPFGLSKIGTDTTTTNAEVIKSSRVLRISLDYYSGMLMAFDKTKELGIPVAVTVYDTDYVRADGAATNARKVEQLINTNDFSDVDVVIGPLLGSNVNRAASILRSKNIPLISPITSRVTMAPNLFQSRPDDATLIAKMQDFLKQKGQDKNIIIIADKENGDTKKKLKSIFPNAKEVNPRVSEDGDYFLYPDDIPLKLVDNKENWVILETNDLPLISNVTTRLNAVIQKEANTTKVTLLTCKRGNAYTSDEIQHTHLMNLNFHYPSIDKKSDSKLSEAFFDSYEDRYDVTPSEHAVRGYDLTMDTILRLAYGDDLYTASQDGIETSYVENKFHYVKTGNGFQNKAVYLIKYGENLTLEEVLLNDTAINQED